MKRVLILVGTVAAFSIASPAMAQRANAAGPTASRANQAASTLPPASTEVSPGAVAATPEMWFYEQEMRRHDDPKSAVRRAAEYDAAQRKARIAARQWYGFSNLRPTADAVPFMSDYSPHWRSNTLFPNQWAGVGGPPILVLRPDYQGRY